MPPEPLETTMSTQSLSSLLQRASIDDHEEVLRSCDAALAKSRSDLQAQHLKIVALLKLDRYEDCLRVFEDGGDDLKKRAALEYGYALYKSGQPDEAIDVVSNLVNDRGARHLEAQAVCSPSMLFTLLFHGIGLNILL
jgi:signal recognition particle subunit SRP72